MKRLVTILVLATVLVGCAGKERPLPSPPPGTDGLVTIGGIVTDAATVPVPETDLRLYRPDGQYYPGKTDADGRFEFVIPPMEECEIRATKAGFQTTRFAISCARDADLLLKIAPPVAGPTPSGGAATSAAQVIRVTGSVLSAGTGRPLAGATLSLEAAGRVVATETINATGGYDVQLLRGLYVFRLNVPCFLPYERSFDLGESQRIDHYLDPVGGGTPAEPQNVRAVPGPGYGQITIAWVDPAGAGCAAAQRYQIYRGTSASSLEPLTTIANSQAWADSGRDPSASIYYQVAAINGAGAEGPRSPAVSARAQATGLPPSLATPRSLPGIRVEEAMFPATDANGAPTADRAWRVVHGTGNCCELYLATTAEGRILDFGGTFLRYSDDLGVTWSEVATPVPYLTGEGAVVAAPNGDIVGIGWTPYTADQLWAHKWSASEKKWYYQTIQGHGPFYDRPWIGVVKGPFEKDGKIIPYVTIIRSGAGANGFLILLSLDGITYDDARSAAAEVTTAPAISVPASAAFDGDRDWTQAHESARTVAIANGVGAYAAGGCAGWTIVGAGVRFGCPATGYKPAGTDRFVVDSLGRLNVVTVSGGSFTYRLYPALGGEATALKIELPSGFSVYEWDFKANAALGQAVIAVHAQPPSAEAADKDFVYRIDVAGGAPVLREVLTVGEGDRASGSGIASSQPRFDFTTIGILPNGKVAVAFADSKDASPQLAIEL